MVGTACCSATGQAPTSLVCLRKWKRCWLWCKPHAVRVVHTPLHHGVAACTLLVMPAPRPASWVTTGWQVSAPTIIRKVPTCPGSKVEGRMV